MSGPHPTPPPTNQAPPTGRGPEPERLAAIIARTWIEVRIGRRPLAQLLPLVAPAVRRRLVAQLPPARTLHGIPDARVRRVVASRPSPRACEATVLIERSGRVTAIAIRLERHRGAWRVVELTAPESGLAPLSTTATYRWSDGPTAPDELAPPLTG